MAAELVALRRHIAGLKGYWRVSTREGRTTADYASSKDIYVHQIKMDLEKSIDKVVRTWNKLEDAMTDLADRVAKPEVDPDPADDVHKELEGYLEEFTAIKELITDEIYRFTKMQQEEKKPTPGPAAPPAGGGGARVYKPNSELKPAILTTQSTPQELKIFLQNFRGYYTSSQLDTRDQEEQQLYFLNCLSGSLRERIYARLTPATPIFHNDPNRDHCIKFLQEEFFIQYPTFQMRLAFQDAKQKEGEAFLDFCTRLKVMAIQADLTRLNADEQILMKIIQGCTSESIKQKIMEQGPAPELETSIQLGVHVSQSDAALKMISGNTTDQPTVYETRGGTRQKKGGQQEAKKPDQNRKPPEGRSKCHRCGQAQDHRKEGSCYAAKMKCHNCQTMGHLAKVCRSPAKAAATAPAPPQPPTTEDPNAGVQGASATSAAAAAQEASVVYDQFSNSQ